MNGFSHLYRPSRIVTGLVGVWIFFSVPLAATADRSCASIKKKVPLSSQSASASVGSHLFTGDDSLKQVAAHMLQDAEHAIDRPAVTCPRGCSGGAKARVVFAARPSKFLRGYSEEGACRERLAATSKRPLRFPGFSFSSAEDFADKFSQFSRGSGAAGDDLYRQCAGACSPQFSLLIHPQRSAGVVDEVQVVCGEARDKSDNRYQLSTSVQWSCGK